MKEHTLRLHTKSCAAVVIGRNEGERLDKCLRSLSKYLPIIVYVDSGSSDGSVALARSMDVAVVELDMNIQFTAARARNKGANYLFENYEDLEFIQFIDGDCEIQSNWINDAYRFLEINEGYAVICGHRRERYPEKSIYNKLCDIEWNTPIGDALTCGGDAMIRADAFLQVKGYDDALIAGEEPEMCFRLRSQGWKIRRINAEMTLHDAAMTSFSQWWNRAKRSGYAYISSYNLHDGSDEKFNSRKVMSVIFWACILPLLTLLLTWIRVEFVLLLLFYPLQVLRVAIKWVDSIGDIKISLLYALSNIGGKIPQFLGMVEFVINKVKGKDGQLIEYK